MLGTRITVEHARGPRREGGGRRDGDRRRAMWVDKYGPPTRTKYRVIVENLSTKMSWQVILLDNFIDNDIYSHKIYFDIDFFIKYHTTLLM